MAWFFDENYFSSPCGKFETIESGRREKGEKGKRKEREKRIRRKRKEEGGGE